MKTALQPEEIKKILKKGKREICGDLTVVYEPQKAKIKRYAILVPKKIAKHAVTRNRMRRITREVLKTSDIPFGKFIIIFNKRKKYTFEDIQNNIKTIKPKA